MTVLVASTTTAYKTDDDRLIFSWLTHADTWRAAGHPFFCAVQLGHGRDHELKPLLDRLDQIDATVWRYSIDEGETTIKNAARLAGICAGRNLAHEYAQRDPDITHILFLDTDIIPPVDAIDRMLEVDNELVGLNVPTYCLDGPPVHTSARVPAGVDVREHEVQTAGCLMVHRDVFRILRWHWDLESGMTDDPCFERDARVLLNVPTWVRHDVVAEHYPACIGPFEQRGHDLTIRR